MRTYRVQLESRGQTRGDFIVEGRDIADANRNLLLESGGWLCKWIGEDDLTITFTPIDKKDSFITVLKNPPPTI